MRNTEGLYIADENVGDDTVGAYVLSPFSSLIIPCWILQEPIPFMPADYLDIINGDVEYEAHHDLESTYWLLCRAAKRSWLNEGSPVSIRGNTPLTHLLHKLTRMCNQNLSHRERERIPLTHEAFLGAMQAAHREHGWPLNDDMLPWVPPEPAGDTEDSDWENDSVIVLCTSEVDEENVESRGASRDARLPTTSEVDNQLDAQVDDVTDDLRRWALDW
ncbi:predicted protein [Postia placenta Mad-698-R]|nr:predicted protein [Postia placenta Mad-698-R]